MSQILDKAFSCVDNKAQQSIDYHEINKKFSSRRRNTTVGERTNDGDSSKGGAAADEWTAEAPIQPPALDTAEKDETLEIM